MGTNISTLSKHRILSLDLDEPVTAAYNLMQKHKIRHVVVSDGALCIGIISDRDVQRATRSELLNVEGRNIIGFQIDPNFRIRDFMSWPVKTVEEGLSIREVTRRMIREKISAFLVTENGNISGIVTHEDLLLYLDALLADKNDSPDIITRLRALASSSSIGTLVNGLSGSGI